MNKPFFRIITWLAIIAVLTMVAMGLWLAVCGGSQSTSSLKCLQLLQTLGTFALPPILGAWWWSSDHRPFAWLKLTKPFSWSTALFAVAIMLVAVPAINLLADLNSRIVLPECLSSVEQFLRQQEDAAAVLTERFLQADNFGVFLLNIGLMALLPALAEELTFRGTLQQIISGSEQSEQSCSRRRSAVAIWTTAIIFSAIHMQFYGFIPRMLLGAMFGYVFLWTGSLWVPILMHFTNNAMAVIAYYLTSNGQELSADKTNWADTIGAGSTWWLGVLSLILTFLGLLIFARRTRKE